MKHLCSVFILTLLPSLWTQPAFCGPNEIAEENQNSTFRVRASYSGYRYSLGKVALLTNGPELNFEKPLGRKWLIGGGIGQAYEYKKTLQTLFTSFEGFLLYSVWGQFTQEERTWRNANGLLVRYSEHRSGGLRMGFGIPNYFFNFSSGAVSFSGLSAKCFYELGLNTPFDLGLGLEFSKLTNPNVEITSARANASILFPL
ncbi:MAG: hypothetical protein RIR26_1742 [Pseudomonadota bacterium]|jgi:hypothetical protein